MYDMWSLSSFVMDLCGLNQNSQLWPLLISSESKPFSSSMCLCSGYERMHEQADRIIRARLACVSFPTFPSLASSISSCVFSLCTLCLSGPSGAPPTHPPITTATGQRGAEVPLRCCLTCTNTTVCFICLCWFCFTLYWATLQSAHPGGPWAVGGP